MHNDLFPDPRSAAAYVSDTVPDFRARIIAHAQKILAYDLEPYPGIAVRAGFKDWTADPVSGKKWKSKGTKVYPPSADADVKFVWELNRHQFLPVLGKAFAVTGDERFAHGALSLLTDWINQNPAGEGINYRSGLEAAIRVISWIWTLSFLPGSSVPSEALHRIDEAIIAHASFIEKNLQARPIPNNHLIGEAAGLFLCGCALKEEPRARAWAQTGLRILFDELFKQVDSDGVDKEQAWDYHRFVMDFYALSIAVSRRAGHPWPSGALRRAEQMHEALLTAMRPDRLAPATGDDDSARALRLSHAHGRDLAPAFSTGAVLFNNPLLKWAAQTLHEETVWLLGRESVQLFSSLPARAPERTSACLNEAGLCFMRSGWDPGAGYLAFDCGPQGMGEAGHGHADALSFELYAKGHELIIDPGTYRYNRAPSWRNFFRGTPAHNTVVIDGKDQAVPVDPKDPFGWKRKANGLLLTSFFSPSHDYACASHDGYERLAARLTHRRSILFSKRAGYWIVSDVITGKGRHTADFLFHAPAGARVTPGPDNAAVITCANGSGILIAPAPGPLKLRLSVIEGSERPIQGWTSFSYGTKMPAPVVSYRAAFAAACRADFVLCPFEAGSKEEIRIESVPAKTMTAAFLLRRGSTGDYYLDSPEAGEKKLGPYTTDALCALIPTSGGGLFCRKGTYVRGETESLIENLQGSEYVARGGRT